MKAYVITLKESDRLQNGKIAGYPSSLPEPEVFYGVERNEPITIPQFSVYKKCRQGTWRCNLSKIRLCAHHMETAPDSDMLLMEDDVIFSALFDEMYPQFMERVPDDWGFIFFGGYHYRQPEEIKPGVLRTYGILGNECVLIRSSVVPEVKKILEDIPWSEDAGDKVISTLFKKYPAYAPVGMFAGQLSGYSYILRHKIRRWGISSEFPYKDLHGNIVIGKPTDYLQYVKRPLSDFTVDIALKGGIGNNLYFISYGRLLREMGVTVNFVDKVVHGQPTRDFAEKECGETLIQKEIGTHHFCRRESEFLMQALGGGFVNRNSFFPELRKYIKFRPIETKNIIAVNFRRGDYLSVENRTWARDLCKTDYYEKAARKCKLLGLPIRIVTDYWDETIPDDIKALFPDAEIVTGDPVNDFYKLAECKYKFIANSTFSIWASYANPESLVFYPLHTQDNLMLPHWVGLTINGKKDIIK